MPAPKWIPETKEGRTALMLAASEGSVNIVRALVLAGADFNACDDEHKNALTYATENDHVAVVRFLKSKGAFETVARVEELPEPGSAENAIRTPLAAVKETRSGP